MGFKAILNLLKDAAKAWVNDNVPRLGAALSYYTVFALSPLFVIVLFIGSLWFNKSSVREALFNQLAGIIGTQGASAIQSVLGGSMPHNHGLLASAIAIITLLLSATGLFIELQSDLNTIWGVEENSGLGVWGFIKNRLLSFAMVVGIGFLLLVSLIVSAALAAFASYIGGIMPGLGTIWMVMHALTSFCVITVLFAMIFKVLPDVKIAWREVWIGAVITALLFTGGKFLLGLYLGRSSTVSAYGAAGSIVLILLWVYYSAQILFFGAELTQAYTRRVGARLEPKNHARWISQPEKKPKSIVRPPGRKEQLVSELREEVESLRDLVHH